MTMLATQNEEVFEQVMLGKSLLQLYIETKLELDKYKIIVDRFNAEELPSDDDAEWVWD